MAKQCISTLVIEGVSESIDLFIEFVKWRGLEIISDSDEQSDERKTITVDQSAKGGQALYSKRRTLEIAWEEEPPICLIMDDAPNFSMITIEMSYRNEDNTGKDTLAYRNGRNIFNGEDRGWSKGHGDRHPW